MPKNTLNTENKIKAITLFEEGYSYRQVVLRLNNNVRPSTILKFKKKYNKTGTVQNKPLKDWPCLLMEKDKRKIICKIIINECSTAIDV